MLHVEWQTASSRQRTILRCEESLASAYLGCNQATEVWERLSKHEGKERIAVSRRRTKPPYQVQNPLGKPVMRLQLEMVQTNR